MHKRVYTSRAEAQGKAEYRSRLMGRPLWVYKTRNGYCLTSKGHHLHQPPESCGTVEDYAASRPSTQEFRDPNNIPAKTYRILYDEKSDSFSQFFQDIPLSALRVILRDPDACMILTLSRPMNAVRATRLVNTIRQPGEGFVWFSFIYRNTLLLTTADLMNEARRPHCNADYIHRAMSLPNSSVLEADRYEQKDPGGESKSGD